MRRPLLYVLVDAVRHDYVEPRRTPYLAGLAAESGLSRMRPLLGYSDSIRAAIFTGRDPDETGYWMEYCYRPGAPALAPFRRLAPLDRLPSDLVRRATKLGLSQTLVRRQARRHGYEHLSLRNLPFRALDRFDWTLRTEMTARGALGAPTIFDHLADAGLPWTYLDASKLGRRRLLAELDSLPRDTSFVFVYLHHVDLASHVVGIRSRLFDRALAHTDALARSVVERTEARLGPLDLAVFSDHGMSPVDRVVSYPSLWRHPGFPSRFCFALDATMVRLWFEDDSEALRDEVREVVASQADGHFLSADERRNLRLDFGNRLYGDEIFLLEPRAAIFPNFHSLQRPKAMHAYHPDDLEQHGIAIGVSNAETVELVDLAPHALRLLGIEPDDLAPAA
ncbi:MAG TPA: alkaline phosphatase family protein [Gaiellaceae bacterium]|nr:alkaline phosphatase family protein [Gaiellaceae bacterium]